MITKGIIKSIDLLGNTCTVHIPFFETAGNDPIIETATVSNTPGSYNGYKVGDAVYVAFEDGRMDTPVVIGKLYLGTEKEKADPRGVINVEESTAAKKATLPADSKLTAQIDSNVPNTTVPYSSLSSIANGLNTLNTNVGQMDRDYGNKFKQVFSDTKGLESRIEQSAEQITNKVLHHVPKGSDSSNTQALGWELTEDHWVVKVYDKQQNGIDFSATGIDLFKITRSSVESSAPEVILSGYPRTTVVRYAYGTKDAFPALYGKKGENCGCWVEGDDPLTPSIVEQNHHMATLDETHMNLYEEGSGQTPGLGNWFLGELSYKATIKLDDNTFMEDLDGTGVQCYIWEWTQTAKYVYDKTSAEWTDFITDRVVKRATTGSVDAVATDIATIEDALTQSINTLTGDVAEMHNSLTDSISQTTAVAQGKSTNYYSVNDPTEDPTEKYVVKKGDCWFQTVSSDDKNYNKELNGNQGKLFQWNGEFWEDIGGELVANKLTATYINALDITAKKIDIGDIFTADAITDNVKIAGFDVSATSLHSSNYENENSTNYVYLGTDKIESVGSEYKFNVTDGKVTADSLDIGPLKITGNSDKATITNNAFDTDKPLVILSTGESVTEANKNKLVGIGGSSTNEEVYNYYRWHLVAGQSVGICTNTKTGLSSFYANRGQIGGFDINSYGLRWPEKDSNNKRQGVQIEPYIITNTDLTYKLTSGTENYMQVNDTKDHSKSTVGMCFLEGANAYAFWAGKEGNLGNKEFRVGHDGTVYTKGGVVYSSDANLKDNILDLKESVDYDTFFDKLQSKTFKFKDDATTTHVGFIAQEVQTALDESNLTESNFAGFKTWTYKTEAADGTEEEHTGYGLNYSEFIALNTAQIQKLKNQVADQETRIAALEEQIAALEEIIKNPPTE